MKADQTIEYKRPDQIMKIYQMEHVIFFVYSYRGVERVVFSNPHKATDYAESPLTSEAEADYRVTINDEEIQNTPEHLRQDMMDKLVEEYILDNDVNQTLINPYNNY
jgi:hypothetical protein